MRRNIRASVWISVFKGMTAGCLLTSGAVAAPTELLKNHYNDPFLQVTNAIKNCPQPRGPFMTVKEAQMEAHPRIERGTTCFMTGKCIEPNAYRYDVRIAATAQEAVQRALTKTSSLSQSSVWLTVQRRFVFVHGCVARRNDAARWEAILRAVPDVEYVGVDLAVVSAGRLPQRIPYPVFPVEQR
jgi:hypothetical protein